MLIHFRGSNTLWRSNLSRASWKMHGHKLCNLVTFSRSRATFAWRMQMLLLASIQRRVSVLEVQMREIERKKETEGERGKQRNFWKWPPVPKHIKIDFSSRYGNNYIFPPEPRAFAKRARVIFRLYYGQRWINFAVIFSSVLCVKLWYYREF